MSTHDPTPGVPELWLIDARGEDVSFEIRRLTATGYHKVASDPDGWLASSLAGRSFRLRRWRVRESRWRYRLENR